MNNEEYVWIANHPLYEWYPGCIISRTNTSVTAVDNKMNEFTIPSDSALFIKGGLPEAVDDLLSLNEFSEALLLHTIRLRYIHSKIYTAIGTPITVALNPYKPLPLYSNALKLLYKSTALKELHHLPPHLYRTAEMVFQNMAASSRGQSILITGESGAGKTESTKIILNYLTSHDGLTGLEEKILFTNPILEAFGNAKTVRNDNSSRFGKYIELYFEDKDVKGAAIESYLLEKSRIVTQSRKERNYHIFYQVFFSNDSDLLQELSLNIAHKYEYLNLEYLEEETLTSNDAEQFGATLQSLDGMGFGKETINAILRVIGGILHLGNIPIEGDADVSHLSKSSPHLDACANLLGVSAERLQSLVCYKNFIDPGSKQVLARNISRAMASANKDTLAKTIYHELFNWLVMQLNSHLFNPSIESSGRKNIIGILDIFGFEIFEENSFEQLCINYANEKLQAHFNDQIFAFEQVLYNEEGIAWQKVDYKDNSQVISLLEGLPHSIFSFLDDECVYTSATDHTFLEKIRYQLAKNTNFIVRKSKAKKEYFGIKHFAGDVYYSNENFLDKNRNSVNRELNEVLSQSSNQVLGFIFLQKLKAEGTISKQIVTVSKQFSNQLNGLLAKLTESFLLYVRCIKPNGFKKPDDFQSREVLAQLKAAGMLQVIKIRKSGFSYRIPYKNFCRDYYNLFRLLNVPSNDFEQFLTIIYAKIIARLFEVIKLSGKGRIEPYTYKGLSLRSQDLAQISKIIPMAEVGLSLDQFRQFGKTKLFAKETLKLILDILYEKSIYMYVNRIQRMYRLHVLRQKQKTLVNFVRYCLSKLSARNALEKECKIINQKYRAVGVIARAYRFYRSKRRLLRRVSEMAFVQRTQKLEAGRVALEKAKVKAQEYLDQVVFLEKEYRDLVSHHQKFAYKQNQTPPANWYNFGESKQHGPLAVLIPAPRFILENKTLSDNSNCDNSQRESSNRGLQRSKAINGRPHQYALEDSKHQADLKQTAYNFARKEFSMEDIKYKKFCLVQNRPSTAPQQSTVTHFEDRPTANNPKKALNFFVATEFAKERGGEICLDRSLLFKVAKTQLTELEKALETFQKQATRCQNSDDQCLHSDGFEDCNSCKDAAFSAFQVVKNSVVNIQAAVRKIKSDCLKIRHQHKYARLPWKEISLANEETDSADALYLFKFIDQYLLLSLHACLFIEESLARKQEHTAQHKQLSQYNQTTNTAAEHNLSITKKLELQGVIINGSLKLLRLQKLENTLLHMLAEVDGNDKKGLISAHIAKIIDEANVLGAFLENKLGQLYTLREIERVPARNRAMV